MQPVEISSNSNHASVSRLKGFSMLATGGTAALVELRKASVSGQRLAVIAMAIDGSANMYYGKPGLAMEGGTYVKVVSGTIEGLLYS